MARRPLRDESVDSKLRSQRHASCGHLGSCGCNCAVCCFDCPLEDCKYDGNKVPKSTVGAIQRVEDAKRLRDGGLTMAEIAKKFGVSRRTVYVWLARA